MPEVPSHPPVADASDAPTPPGPTRRVVLLGGLVTAIAAASYSVYEATFGSALPRHATTTARASAVTGIALPVLPREDGTLENGVRTFRLKLSTGKTTFLEGQETTTWGINGAFLGPVLHANRGEKVRVLVENQVGEPTTMHWHGMHLPAVMDGGPFQPIAAGATWEPEWEIRQSAATLWFHPHFFGKTRDHVMKGLAGVFAIHDPTEVGLPDKHGEDDFSIILQETLLNDKGQIDTSDGTRLTLVNGAIAPRLELPAGPTRLRLLNASDSRGFQLAFDDGRPLVIVGVDGGRLNNPVSVADVILGPGERIELIVDRADARLIALNPDATQGTGATTTTANATLGDAPADVLLQLEGGPKGVVAQTPFPSAPSATELPDPARATVNRRLVLEKGGPGLTIGIEGGPATPAMPDMPGMPGMPDMPGMPTSPGTTGLAQPPTTMPPATAPSSGTPTTTNSAGSSPPTIATIPGVPTEAMEEPSFETQIGTTEVWAIENKTDVVHYFHVHDVQFKVIDRDGQPPLEHELGRKDVVRIEATSTVRIALELTDYVDPLYPYMFHCHMLTHEDQGMMGHFTVVAAKAPPT